MGCSPVIIIRSTSPAANSFSFMRPSLCGGPIFNFRSPLGWNCDCDHGPRGGAGDIEFSPEFIDSLAHSGEADAGGSIRLPALQSCRGDSLSVVPDAELQQIAVHIDANVGPI